MERHAAAAARARLNADPTRTQALTTLDPTDPINRAKREEVGVIAPEPDAQNPMDPASVQGYQGSGPAPTADGLPPGDTLPGDFPGLAALRAAGYTSLSAVSRLSDEQLDDIPGIGLGTITQIRNRLKG